MAIQQEVPETSKLQGHNPILSIVGPLVLVDAGGGWHMNIAEYSSTTLTWDWLGITMGHTEGFD